SPPCWSARTRSGPDRSSPATAGRRPHSASDTAATSVRTTLLAGTDIAGHSTRIGRRIAPPRSSNSMADWTPPTQDRVERYFKELNNWGRWGHDDQKGTVNLITPAKRQGALGLVKTGRTVSLARDVVPMPVFMYHATFPSTRERADVVLDRFDMVYHGFWITHIDALCHVAWDRELYNGRPFMDSLSAAGATWCPIDPLFDGITTRGLLLDVAAGRKEGFVTVGNPVTPRELDEVARRQGVRVEPGDVVVVRSGDDVFRRAHPEWVPRESPHPGLHLSCLEWFREK